MAKIIRVFFDSDMRGQHKALSERASDVRINTGNLRNGEYLVFVNRAEDRIKIFAANNIVAYYKSPRGRIDRNTIALIPQVFEGGRINYDRALKKTLDKRLGRNDNL